MPPIKDLEGFRVELKKVLLEAGLAATASPVDLLLLEINICSLALDYADGFYRSSVEQTLRKVKL